MNVFNGLYLIYYVDINLYNDIKSYFKTNIIYLYTNKNSSPELYKYNKKYILPIGLFSNPGFILQCKWENTNRNFNQIMPNKDFIINNITLTNVQNHIINEYLKHVNIIKIINKSPIYINLVGQCSIGKTVLAIYIMMLYKLKTFVITPSIELAKQWKKEIVKFLNNIKCYQSLNGVKALLKMDKNELLSYDVICIPYKHLNNTEFNDFLSKNFSMGIIDEQHTYNMETNEVLQKFFTFYSYPIFISLTATPRSKNAFYFGREIILDKIISKYKNNEFKKIAYEICSKKKYNIFLNYDDINQNYYQKYINLRKKKILSQKDAYILSNYKKRALSHDAHRISVVCKYILKSFLNNIDIKNPKILVLTKFVEEIEMYKGRLLKKIPQEYIFTIHAKNQNLLDVKNNVKNLNKYILIGTEDHLGTGIDIVELNILHLTSIPINKNNIIQYAGRVSRDNSTDIHNIYYYNTNNLSDLSIDLDITFIRETLIFKQWNCVYVNE